MTMIIDLSKYKKAKILIKDVEKILEIILKTKEQLKPYGKYSPVRDLYLNLMNNQSILESHLRKLKASIQTKSSTDEVENT